MLSSRQFLAGLATAALTSSVNAAMGPAFSLGPVTNNSLIRESISTLVIPRVPAESPGDTSLWIGMSTSKGDLIQSIVDHLASDVNWSVFAYTLVKTSETTQMEVEGKKDQAQVGDKVTMHYKFDDATGNYTQRLSVNGQLVSTVSTNSGYAMGWGAATECAETNCGTIEGHTWIDTTITLGKADPNFDQTLVKDDGVTGEMSTSDGGMTWTITDINIPKFKFGSQ